LAEAGAVADGLQAENQQLEQLGQEQLQMACKQQ
jgi:hypothetical protein